MLGDLIQETASAPGNSATINLGGPAAGRTGFLDVFASGADVFYAMADGTLFELGQGSVTAGSPDTLSRTTVLANSAGTTARLNFTGTTRVYCAMPAARAVWLDASGLLQNITAANLRSSAGAPAIPTASSGVPGEFPTFNPGVGNAATLPAGGTWSWFLITFVNATGAWLATEAGVDAGGTTVRTASPGNRHEGFAWRIA
jgi:hypothetical protein